MTCVLCGRAEKSDPAVQSNWTALEWGDDVHYICPDELPGAGASSNAFTMAYLRVFERIAALAKKH